MIIQRAPDSLSLPRPIKTYGPRILRIITILGLGLTLNVRTGRANADIRPEPGGKRLLYLDGNDIRPEPGGKRLLYLDGNDVRPEPGGKRLLYLDGSDVRPEPGGIRLAIWDGNTLRRSPGGKILLFLDGSDIRPEPGGKRLYYVDGGKLTIPQLTAVMFQLKPELFTLSNDEKNRLQKEFAAAGAEAEAEARRDQLPGVYRVMVANSSDDKAPKGALTVIKQGKYYAVSFDGDAPWKGIGVKHVLKDGTEELWAAAAPGAAVSLGLYEAGGDKLTGTWVPTNAADDPAVLGSEVLVGPASGGGAYKIESGQLPNGGVKYTGAMKIEPTDAPLTEDCKSYVFRWATGTTGAGFSMDESYAVAAGWGDDYGVFRLRAYLGNLTGDFVGKNNHGSYVLCK